MNLTGKEIHLAKYFNTDDETAKYAE